jgi:hypothetical protein
MFTIIGIYFTHNFTGVYFSFLSGFLNPYIQRLVSLGFNSQRYLTCTTDTPFREYGIESFHLCVPTTNTVYVYSSVPFSLFSLRAYLSHDLQSPIIVSGMLYRYLYDPNEAVAQTCQKVPCSSIRHTRRRSRGMERSSTISG